MSSHIALSLDISHNETRKFLLENESYLTQEIVLINISDYTICPVFFTEKDKIPKTKDFETLELPSSNNTEQSRQSNPKGNKNYIISFVEITSESHLSGSTV